MDIHITLVITVFRFVNVSYADKTVDSLFLYTVYFSYIIFFGLNIQKLCCTLNYRLFLFCILHSAGRVWCVLGVWWVKPTLSVQDKSAGLRSFGTLKWELLVAMLVVEFALQSHIRDGIWTELEPMFGKNPNQTRTDMCSKNGRTWTHKPLEFCKAVLFSVAC